MEITEILGNQMQEAFGPDNKWFCSQCHGYEVRDPEVLLKHYIKNGGAKHYREKVQPRQTADAGYSSRT